MPVVFSDSLVFNFVYKNENFLFFLDSLFNFSFNDDKTVQSILDSTNFGTSYISD